MFERLQIIVEFCMSDVDNTQDIVIQWRATRIFLIDRLRQLLSHLVNTTITCEIDVALQALYEQITAIAYTLSTLEHERKDTPSVQTPAPTSLVSPTSSHRQPMSSPPPSHHASPRQLSLISPPPPPPSTAAESSIPPPPGPPGPLQPQRGLSGFEVDLTAQHPIRGGSTLQKKLEHLIEDSEASDSDFDDDDDDDNDDNRSSPKQRKTTNR